MSEKNDYVEDAREQLQRTGIKTLDRLTKSSKPNKRVVYDKKHKILGLVKD